MWRNPDPTLEGAQQLEIKQKKCGVCVYRGRQVFDDTWLCSKELAWPKDRPRCPKFKLDQ